MILGSCEPIKRLREDIAYAARADAKVLITGESGAGKELVARAIHDGSARSSGPFMTINCAGIPETLLESELFGHVRGSFTGAFRDRPGLLESARRGTVFLDEVGEMSLRMQGLLLRFLETGEIQRVGADLMVQRVDVRVVAATNRPLNQDIEEKRFRSDLYYRLNVIHLVVPSLRERRDDVPLLLKHFVDSYARRYNTTPCQFSDEAQAMLTAYDWPGNVRELERVIERVVTMTPSGPIQLDDLPASIRGPFAEAVAPALQERETLRAFTSRYVRLMLDRCAGNKRATCRALGISYHTLVAHLNYRPHAPASHDATPVCPDDTGLVGSSRNS
jgi:transcriptional regulator with PAS, ATPase and Fis domain